MDKILEGIALSDHAEAVKRAVINRVLSLASSLMPSEQVTGVLETTADWICKEESTFLQEMGRVIFEAWSCHHPKEFEQFFNNTFLVNTFTHEIPRPPRTLAFVNLCLKNINDKENVIKIFQSQSISIARDYPDIRTTSQLCSLLMVHPECIPGGSYSNALVQTVMKNLSKLRMPFKEEEVKKCLDDVASISSFVNFVWQMNLQAIIPSLACIFEIISQGSVDKNPSAALGSLVQFIPENIIGIVTKNVTTDSGITDYQLTLAMTRIIDWLSWPGVKNIDKWIIAFLRSLASVHKFPILIHVTIATVETVFAKLSYPSARESALAVFSHTMLSFQHSPEAFHKVVGLIPELMNRLQEETSVSSIAICTKLAQLTYTLMYQFSGYPELYGPVIKALKDYVPASESEMKASLEQATWTAQHKSLFGLSSKFAPKSDTGKTGLVNLGNTCYMNSILQALYVTKGFMEDVLYFPHKSSRQTCLAQLQMVFAFLSQSQRSAYSPDDFLNVSRPPWFAPGSQQDCSEFLKYLLERIDEEMKILNKILGPVRSGKRPSEKRALMSESTSKASVQTGTMFDSFVQRHFGGKSSSNIRCLNCGMVSSRVESFVDIPLAFPETDASARTKGLGGGDAKKRPCPDLAMCDAEETKPSDLEPTNLGHVLQDEGLTPDEVYAFQQASSTSASYSSPEKTLESLLEHFFNPELLNGDNQYMCDSCRRLQDAERTTEVIEAPKVLVLTLMRFSYDAVLQRRCKILDHVKIPKNITLPLTTRELGDRMEMDENCKKEENKESCSYSKKMRPVDSVQDSSAIDVHYTLTSAVVHSGLSSESGHYYCYGRTDQSDLEDVSGDEASQWCLFNDSRVSFSSFKSLSKVTSNFPKDTAYVLFYTRIPANENRRETALDQRVLMTDLQEVVTRDNKDFVLELEKESREAKLRKPEISMDCSNSRQQNFDDNNDPPGGCGLGGGGGIPTTRLVF